MAESNPIGRDKYKSRVGGLQGYGEGVERIGGGVKDEGCMVRE